MSTGATVAGWAAHVDQIQPVAAQPNWSESLVIEVNDPVAGLAVWAHFSRIPAAPDIWECDLVVYDEDDSLLVSRSFCRAARPDEAGGVLAMRCVRPGQAWTLSFDSMARRVGSADSLAAPVTDGAVEHLAVDLRFDALHPAWSAGGLMESATWASGHVEQAGRIHGKVVVRGRDAMVDGVGFRDHSYGPRDYAHLIGNTWATGVFPDGTVLLALAVWAEPAGSAPAQLGFYWDGEALHELAHTGLAALGSPDGGPRHTRFVAAYPGVELPVDVELIHRAGFTLQSPVGMSLGVTPDRDNLATVVESPAILRCGDKAAYGWYEQNLRRSQIGV